MLSRQEAEDFLFEEAETLDTWQLDKWLEYFTEDTRYVVPSTDLPEGDPKTTLVLIDDDIVRLRARVVRLKSRHAHREYPWSRTRRLITNVRVTGKEGDNYFITANYIVYRFRNEQVDPFIGKYEYTLTRVNGELKIKHRKAIIDQESLSPNGAVSIIL